MYCYFHALGQFHHKIPRTGRIDGNFVIDQRSGQKFVLSMVRIVKRF